MCSCTSCTYTDSFSLSGFNSWPRGNPAGKKSQADYAAHVRHCFVDTKKRPGPGPSGAAYYGVPAGSTLAKQAEVLRRTFAVTITAEE